MLAQPIEIRFAANHAGFARAFVELRAALDTEQLDGAARYDAELVFEEIVSNIVHHGATANREVVVSVRVEHRPHEVILSFDDNGQAFDPCQQASAIPAKPLEHARAGGFGLMLVRRASSALTYRRTPEGHNQLAVVIRR